MNKKIIISLTLLLSSAAQAAFSNNNPAASGGGFSGPSSGTSSTQDINNSSWLHDDKPVILEGHILNAMGGDYYLFKDDRGSITIEIDNEDWMGVHVTPQNRVRIYGHIDKEMMERTVVDVSRIEILR